jgi:hypothetical protein
VPVKLAITGSLRQEMKTVMRLFISRNFLFIIPLIAQGVYAEAVIFTFQSLWFTVRARALGSFLSGIVAIACGNGLGVFLDRQKIPLKKRARWAFFLIMGFQGVWWTWATILVTDFHKTKPTFDWVDAGFGKGFALFLCSIAGFQVNYMYL